MNASQGQNSMQLRSQRQEPGRVGYLLLSLHSKEQGPGSPRGSGTDEAQGQREWEGAGGAGAPRCGKGGP